MKKFSFFLVLIVLIIGGALAWWNQNTMAVDGANQTRKLFVISKGEGIRDIANHLKAEGLVRDSVIFFLLVKQQGLDNKIQAGEFYLSPSMNAQKIAEALQVGTFDTRLTIPEGKRAEEIADILQKQIPTYQESWRTQLAEHEGYLFPDTYAFAKDVTIDQIITAMKDNFDKKYAEIPSGKHSNLTQKELVTIASLVEREAKFAEDRPLVASVIFNRLKINMPLQIDATVQYALGYNSQEKTWWKKNLTIDDLEISSPYNTYENTGLPPQPIANPGFDVLSAIINAPETDYVYYISDDSGHNHYSRTLDEHNANIKKYGLDQ